MNRVLLATFGLILFSCSNQEMETEEAEDEIVYANEKIDLPPGIPFYDFDSVEHYRIEIPKEEIWSMADLDSGETNYFLYQFLTYNIPEEISDTSFLSELEPLGYQKNVIDPSKHDALNEIFSEKQHPNFYEYNCFPEYRDVFVFKDSNGICGIAKVCFSCDQSYLLGATGNTDLFGMSGDYQRLWELLYEEN